MASASMLRSIFNTALSAKNGGSNVSMQELSEKEQMFVDGLKYPNTYRALTLNDYYYGSSVLKIDWNMEIKEPTTIREEMLMTHDQYVVWLKRKYGHPTCNYYTTALCTIKNNKIERLYEGLILHHLAEECRTSLTGILNQKFGIEKPYDLYEPNNFIYCNYFEHLLLHIKIMIEDLTEPEGYGTDVAGARNIWRELNGFYEKGTITLPYKVAAEKVKDRYDEYIFIMKCLCDLIQNEPRCSMLIDPYDLIQDKNGIIMNRLSGDILNL